MAAERSDPTLVAPAKSRRRVAVEMLSRARALYGTDEPIASSTALRAGPLTLTLRAGRLWNIALGDVEIWHGVAFLYRDVDWGTPEPVIDHCKSTLSARAFSIRCSGRFPTSPVIDFGLELEGTSAGLIRITGEAIPRGDIATNRLGLCAMHSMALGGRRVDIVHTDGRTSKSTFPVLIPPWPPFMLVRAIRHEYARNCWGWCRFEGDDFELEDQRNNADASFKTYSRSNMMPRPYELHAGVPVRQSIELSLEKPWPRAARRREAAVAIDLDTRTGDVPPVGIEIGAGDDLTGEAARKAMRALRPAHVHVVVTPDAARVEWKAIGRLIDASGAQLRLDVVATDTASLARCLDEIRTGLADARIAASSVAVFPSAPRCIDLARAAFPHASIGGGTAHFFVQLNRSEGVGAVDFLSFTTSAIVHGTDEESVMQSLRSLPSMVQTLNARYPGVPVRIGPSTIAARRSPLGRQPPSDGTRRIALAQVDPRSRGMYGAAWLIGYVAQVAASGGVDAVTLMSLFGHSGLLVRTTDGAIERFPAYHALACLRGGRSAAAVKGSDPSRVATFAVSNDGLPEVLLANLGCERVEVEVRGRGTPGYAAVLDCGACAAAIQDDERQPWHWERVKGNRLTLDAYAIARMRGEP
jgi:hypothetical protein